MSLRPESLPESALAFLRERHLATLTTLRADGSPHVVPVGFTYDPLTRLARVITSGDSAKARNAQRRSIAALCQVDRGRWITLSGRAWLDREPAAVSDAEARYAVRYRTPRVNPRRAVLVLEVQAVLGRLG